MRGIRHQIRIVGHELVDPDRSVPHRCITESFEDRSVEGLHVDSHLLSVSVVGGN